jgi:hypothetical protein
MNIASGLLNTKKLAHGAMPSEICSAWRLVWCDLVAMIQKSLLAYYVSQEFATRKQKVKAS